MQKDKSFRKWYILTAIVFMIGFYNHCVTVESTVFGYFLCACIILKGLDK